MTTTVLNVSPTGTTLVVQGDSVIARDQAVAASVTAVAASAAATGIVASLTPYIDPVGQSPELGRLLSVEFLPVIAGVTVTLPARLVVREIARDGLHRFRLRFASFTAPSTYVEVAGEQGNGTYLDVTGMTGDIEVPILAITTAFGVPIGTVLGTATVNIDGTFGTYFSPDIEIAEKSELSPLRIKPSTGTLATIDEFIARSQAAFDAERGTLFRSDATDDFARGWIRDIQIAGLDADDVPYINYQREIIGAPYFRLKIFLHSTKLAGAVVAQFTTEAATAPPTFEDTITLSMVSNGAVQPGYVGVSATIKFDWTFGAWNQPLTVYANSAATGIAPGRVQAAEETRSTYRAPAMAKPAVEHIRVSPTGDFTTAVAAVAAVENVLYGNPTTRSTYPSSGRCAITRSVLIDIVGTAHTEQVIAFTNSGIDQSPLRIIDGMTLRLRPDTLIYVDSVGSPTSPVVEFNSNGRIEGTGTLENRRSGYVVHVDNFGVLSIPNANGAMRHMLTTYFGGVTLRKTQNNNDPMVGMGIANRQAIIFDGTRFDKVSGASTAPMIYCHTSPNTVMAGQIELRGVTSNAPVIALAKSHTLGSARHGILIEASDVTTVTHANENGTTGSGWIRLGTASGVTYDAALAP